ncbi:proteinase-activated receptor 2-like [Pomacea canaliculata]|uniref:proteinase-activated receptor 2-like n=1 Tax=Pomacea canaliculata TaxID=400727 RepID=UPI000D7301D7|nr:proteinase-activated receptor 2-like [Pomacea canaliculata]
MAVIPTEGAISAALYFTTALSTVSSTDDEVSNFSTDCIQVMHQDYPDDPISTEVERLLGKIREAIVMPILFVTGVMGSVVSLVAFYRQNLNNRINLCLFSLELVNLINISFLFILNFDSLYRPFDEGDTGVVGTFMTNSKMLGMLGFMYGAMYLSAVVSCERCFSVLFPLHSKTLISTKVILIVIIFGSCLTVIPFFVVTWSFQVVCFHDIVTNVVVNKPTSGDFYFQHKEVINIIEGTYYGIILSLGIPIVVVISTALTGWKLNQSIAFRKETSTSDTKKETAITKMLVTLSIEFLVLSLPNIIIRIIHLFEPEVRFAGRYNNSYFLLINIAETGSILNSSIDFFVYYSAGTKFRDTVHEMFPCLDRKSSHP